MVLVVDEQTCHQDFVWLTNCDCELGDACIRRQPQGVALSARELTLEFIDEQSNQFFEETAMTNNQHICHTLMAAVAIIKAAASARAHT